MSRGLNCSAPWKVEWTVERKVLTKVAMWESCLAGQRVDWKDLRRAEKKVQWKVVQKVETMDNCLVEWKGDSMDDKMDTRKVEQMEM